MCASVCAHTHTHIYHPLATGNCVSLAPSYFFLGNNKNDDNATFCCFRCLFVYWECWVVGRGGELWVASSQYPEYSEYPVALGASASFNLHGLAGFSAAPAAAKLIQS